MYRVVIDELVLTEDFKRITQPGRQRIIKAIRKKLSTEPERFGAPIKGPLKGYWKLRVGEYRVVYEIRKGEVLVYVIAVGFRRNEEVYREVLRRLRG